MWKKNALRKKQMAAPPNTGSSPLGLSTAAKSPPFVNFIFFCICKIRSLKIIFWKNNFFRAAVTVENLEECLTYFYDNIDCKMKYKAVGIYNTDICNNLNESNLI